MESPPCSRDGDAVVQAYVVFPRLPGAPNQALCGFTRIHLRAGESRKVQFALDARDLSHVNMAGVRIVGSGQYGIAVGGGQPGAGSAIVSAKFEIQGELELPR